MEGLTYVAEDPNGVALDDGARDAVHHREVQVGSREALAAFIRTIGNPVEVERGSALVKPGLTQGRLQPLSIHGAAILEVGSFNALVIGRDFKDWRFGMRFLRSALGR